MLPVSLNVGIMLTGYLLVMGYLAFGLRILRRYGAGPGRRAELPAPVTGRRGWSGLIRQVAGTAVGGYLLLMAVVVGYYHGVARVGGRFLMSAATGAALLVGIALPVFLIISWLVERRRHRRASRAAGKRPA
ncbi:hypothetical protein GCM10020367_60870 [Streptomyces sannanensis]|uniref:Integral membrane protein n=1 Tax=Streptomyces sannanensis TaxID=285536 RepID=A0ABP6SK91_9ACTN